AAARGAGVDVGAKRSLEVGDRDLERAEEPLGEPDTTLGDRAPLERVGGLRNRRLEPRPTLVELGRERPAAGLELEQQRLDGLACEPQLAPFGVVAEAL